MFRPDRPPILAFILSLLKTWLRFFVINVLFLFVFFEWFFDFFLSLAAPPKCQHTNRHLGQTTTNHRIIGYKNNQKFQLLTYRRSNTHSIFTGACLWVAGQLLHNRATNIAARRVDSTLWYGVACQNSVVCTRSSEREREEENEIKKSRVANTSTQNCPQLR